MGKGKKSHRQELIGKLSRLAMQSMEEGNKPVTDESEEVQVYTRYVDQKCPYTYVKVSLYDGKDRYVESGFSKCCWPDVFDSSYGYGLAIKKAVSAIAKAVSAERQGGK